MPANHDPVNHPKHYTGHPSGVECIQITEHMNFCLGNAMKYIWRAGEKGDALEDLRKARWYLDREIKRREKDLAKQSADLEKEAERIRERAQSIEPVSAPPPPTIFTSDAQSASLAQRKKTKKRKGIKSTRVVGNSESLLAPAQEEKKTLLG